MTTVAPAWKTAVARLGGPRPIHVGPNWFSIVMGTGIVANASMLLPFDGRPLELFARGMWVVSVIALAAVVTATVRHWATRPDIARGHFDHPVMAHFYGAPAMALMTVGAGGLLVGHQLIGPTAALALDAVLWTTGTMLGLWTLWAVPRRTLRRAAPYSGPAFGGWLMPVVPPMVSAATGAQLVPHLSPAMRPVMLGGCYLLAVIAAAASVPLLVLIVRRTIKTQLCPAASVPTLFIVVGPLGQSVTAAHALGDQAGGAWRTLGIALGCPILAASGVWLAVATVLTARTVAVGLPFGLTWWSFTFPLGTVVTGASGLAAATGSMSLAATAVTLFVVLVTVWAVVAALTVRGVWNGSLLRPQTV